MKKTLLGLFLMASLVVTAQDNAVKLNLNLPSLALANKIGVIYERKLTDALSVSGTFSFSSRKAAPLSGFLTEYATEFLDSNSVNTDLFNNKFKSFGFELQFRYYAKKEALKGFYIAPYFGISSSKLETFDFDFPDQDVPNLKHGGTVDLGYTSMGAGIGLGNQWIVGKGLTVDIMWIGLGIGTTNFKIEGNEQPGETVDFAAIDADVQEFIDTQDDPFITRFAEKIDKSYTDDWIRLSVKQGIPYTRLLNFSIGWSF